MTANDELREQIEKDGVEFIYAMFVEMPGKPCAQLVPVSALDGLMSAEIAHDPFIPLALAALATVRIQLSTGITVAFPRSPMVIAQLAWDLQAESGGRFVLGLGSQVKGHIERRFSVPWTQPVARMREYLSLIHI